MEGGRLNTERLLGSGSMGAVYLARDTKGAPHALKVLTDHHSALSKMFEQEVGILSKLKHPSLVAIEGFSKHGEEIDGIDDQACFWMEYIPGKPVLTAAKNTDTTLIIKWFSEALDALEYLHSQGVLHGDLKPANIIISKTNSLKLVDFGLATLSDNRKHQAGQAKGAIPYMAPEVLNGERLPASDLFSLGTIFYQALSGQHPRAKAKNLRELFEAKISSLRQLNPAVPTKIARVIERLIEPDRAKRLKTAHDAKEAIFAETEAAPRHDDSFYSFKMFGVETSFEEILKFKDKLKIEETRGVVFVHGLTGVGKSRFLREVFFELALQGCRVLQNRAHAQLEFPAQVLSEKSRKPGTAFPVQMIHRAELLSPQQLKEIYHFLKKDEAPALLILEYNEEYLPEFHQSFFSSLSIENGVLDIRLRNLSFQDTKEFLTANLRTQLSTEIIQDLFNRTHGNPKLLTELCREIVKSQILTKKRLTTKLFKELQLPKSTTELFRQRLDKLGDIQKQLLCYLALAYGPTKLDKLMSLNASPVHAIRHILEDFLNLGLININSEGDGNTYQISHPSLSQLILLNLSVEERLNIHRNWYQLLKEQLPTDQQEQTSFVPALAHHSVEDPDNAEQFHWVQWAGKLFSLQENLFQALDLFRKCLPNLKKATERESLLRSIINCLGRLGRFAESYQVLQTWHQEFEHDPEGINTVKYWLSSAVSFQNQGDLQEARKRFEKCILVGDVKKTSHLDFIARAYSLLGLLEIQENQLDQAQKNFEQALHLLPTTSTQTAEVYKHQALLAAHRDQWKQVLASLKKAEAMYHEIKHPVGLFSIALERGNLALNLGKITEVKAAYQQALQLAEQNKDDAALARVYQNLGVIACRTGDYAQALEELEKAREIFTFLGNPMDRGINLLQLSLANAAVGRFRKSETLFKIPKQQGQISDSFNKRIQEVEFQISLYRDGEAPTKNISLFEIKDLSKLPKWDLEQRLLQSAIQINSADNKIYITEIAKTIQEMYQKLPDTLKISFEDRGDYRRWVLGEKITPDLSKIRGKLDKKTEGINKMDILNKISEITKEILSSNNIEQVLVRLMDAAMEISKAKHGFIIIQSKNTQGPFPGFEVKVARNMAKEEIEGADFRVSLSALSEALKTGEPLVTDNALQDSRFEAAESVHQLELKSILALPLKGTSGIVGALYLDHPYKTDIFQEADINLLQMLADQAALALQKAQMILQLEKANNQLAETVQDQASEIVVLKREVKDQRGQLTHEYKEIIGHSPAMLELLSLVDRVTETKVPVWIYGESGTGKEMIARALHFNSSRAKESFVSENCSALPETLLESELFGHKKGAFTHADRDKKGLIEHADKGTIFLDEIADMSTAMQAKLLRFLQEGEIRPLGSNEILKVDVRVVSASNRDLQMLVAENKFREDLYYRLNGVTVTLPPLRDRMEDLPILTQHFLKKIAKEEGKDGFEISTEALEKLMGYQWPGNIRELENTLRTASLFNHKGKITLKSLNFKKQLSESGKVSSLRGVSKKTGATAKKLSPQTARLSEEKRLLLQALHDAGFHKGHAAKELGISRRYLYTQLLRHQVPVNRIEMKAYIEEQLGLG